MLLLLLLYQPSGIAEPSKNASCGGHLTARRGTISTPNFPGAFEVPIHCRWILDASELSERPNASITVYLSQLYAFRGVSFREFAYYESETTNFGEALVREIDESNAFEVRSVSTSRPYLLLDFHLERLEGNHVRVLDHLLDVYGFNVTYEMSEYLEQRQSCSIGDCSFAGNCLLASDRA